MGSGDGLSVCLIGYVNVCAISPGLTEWKRGFDFQPEFPRARIEVEMLEGEGTCALCVHGNDWLIGYADVREHVRDFAGLD